MKTSFTKEKYVEWLNAEVMHKASREWLSELRFINDEQLFFDDLIKSYTLQLIDSSHFDESKKMVEKMTILRRNTDMLIKTVMTHENDLEVMVDDKEELTKEKAYQSEHRNLIITISEFLKDYRIFKTRLFVLVKGIIRDQKQKRLLQ